MMRLEIKREQRTNKIDIPAATKLDGHIIIKEFLRIQVKINGRSIKDINI